MTEETHVENEPDLIYPYKIRIFYISDQFYYMNVPAGGETTDLDHWLALERENGYYLNEITPLDEYRAIVVLERDTKTQVGLSVNGKEPYKFDVFDKDADMSSL